MIVAKLSFAKSSAATPSMDISCAGMTAPSAPNALTLSNVSIVLVDAVDDTLETALVVKD